LESLSKIGNKPNCENPSFLSKKEFKSPEIPLNLKDLQVFGNKRNIEKYL